MTTPTTINPTQQVFERVLARTVDAPDLQHGRLVHLMWRAPVQGERLVQVYLNGQLSTASRSIIDRQAWLMLDHDKHTQIELLAVCPSTATADQNEHLSGASPCTQPFAAVRIMRDTAMPIDSCVSLEVEGASVNDQAMLFSPSDPRGGFGSVFGEGSFGYDHATGPGLGMGELGFGPLGSDGNALCWRSDTLARGTHHIDLSLHDAAGLPVAPTASIELTIDRLPDPPSSVVLTDELTLTWT